MLPRLATRHCSDNMQSRRRKTPTSYLGSLSARSRELISSARDTYLERLDSSDIAAGQKAMLLRIAGLSSTHAVPQNRSEIDVSDEDGALSLPYTKRMLKWLAEGVGRGLELANGHETPKDVRELLSLLVSNLGEIYLETALDSLIDLATTQESSTKSEPDFTYVNDLRTAISILHLLLTTIQTLLLPLTASNLTIRRDLDKQAARFSATMESRIDAVLQKTLDAALTWSSRLLALQKKTDFRPRDDATLQLDTLQTPTCLALHTFVTKLYARLEFSLQGSGGKALETVALELALGLRGLLLLHFRQWQVSQTGGLVVSKDVAKYCEGLRAWTLPGEFKQSLDVLTEIANLFVIGPEALRERLRGLGGPGGAAGGGLVGVEKADLRPYVLRRDDVGSVAVQSVLGSL